MFALFEDRLASPGAPVAWVFEGCQRKVSGAWATLNSALCEAAKQGFWGVVALDYELGKFFEPTVGAPPDKVGTLWVFAHRRALDADTFDAWWHSTLKALPAAHRIGGVSDLQASWTEQQHANAVHAIQSYIAEGDCYQVNLTFPLQFSYFGHPIALFAALREQQPARYGCLIADPESPILSLSPELFVDKSGDRIVTRPMKGTMPRGRDAESDQAAAKGLAQSEKNRAENLMIVDLLRNDLSRLRGSGGAAPRISVPQLFVTEAYPTLWQMVSQVEAEFLSGAGAELTPESLLQAVFPCGSITGAPKVRAMQIIDSLEQGARGIYTGSLGWFAPNGDARLNVAIRTLQLKPHSPCSGVGVLGVGGGIVQDSVAAEEWAECWLKARFLTQLDPGIRLIETLRLEPTGYPLLEAHLTRLMKSARALGFVCEWTEVQECLEAFASQALAENPAVSCWRVRLTLDAQGRVELSKGPLAPEPALRIRKLFLASERVDACHPLQNHKTSWRTHYDEALIALADHPDIFDALFLNTRDEVVEGARSSLFVQRNGLWQTPPLSSGALPGVWRAEVLAGRVPGMENAEERVLTRADLENAARIVCGNALRGAIEIREIIFPERIRRVHPPATDKPWSSPGKP